MSPGQLCIIIFCTSLSMTRVFDYSASFHSIAPQLQSVVIYVLYKHYWDPGSGAPSRWFGGAYGGDIPTIFPKYGLGASSLGKFSLVFVFLLALWPIDFQYWCLHWLILSLFIVFFKAVLFYIRSTSACFTTQLPWHTSCSPLLLF